MSWRRRERAYRDDRPPCDVRNHTVIVVDDGLATGATMRIAVAALRRLGPDRIVVAVPTAAPESCRQLAREADECVSVMQPDPFYAVGIWYDDFAQVTDDEVRDILLEAATELRENRTQASIVARAVLMLRCLFSAPKGHGKIARGFQPLGPNCERGPGAGSPWLFTIAPIGARKPRNIKTCA